jgi:hypothetical protein
VEVSGLTATPAQQTLAAEARTAVTGRKQTTEIFADGQKRLARISHDRAFQASYHPQKSEMIRE